MYLGSESTRTTGTANWTLILVKVNQSTGPGQTACHSVKVRDDVVYKKTVIIIIINQPMFLFLLKMIVIINIEK